MTAQPTPATDMAYHTPVMLRESVDGLNVRPDGIYVDVTFGGGGHSREILSRLGPKGRLYSFDQDSDATTNLAGLDDDPRFQFVRSNFRFLANWMRYYRVDHIDGLLADLGVSGHHFDDPARGFSLRFDAPLDMRMNQKQSLTAADVVNLYDEARLADVLYIYGELKNARRLAATLVAARQKERIATTGELLAAVDKLMPAARKKKDEARLFQALRIEVNGEMSALEQLMVSATELLGEGGRLSVITYHSLEDRIVKNFVRAGNASGYADTDFFGRRTAPLEPLASKPATPTAEEQERNPRSRSAKLRVAEKRRTEAEN